MSSHASVFLAAPVVLFLSCAGCTRESAAFTLDIEALRQLGPENTAGITYEEDRGTVFVTVTDKHGDGHKHRLVLGDATRVQALELLRQKQAELEQRK
jgi:hypothetical protein